VLERGLFAEGSARPQEGHRKCFLDGAAGRYDFREQVRHGVGRQWTGIVLLQPAHHLGLALRAIDRPVPFHVADLARQLCALVHEPQQLVVDGVDAVAQLLQLIRHDGARSQAGR
jgi:hypothetical protein